MVTILNAILLWLIFGTEPGWSWLMTLQRYTPSFKASWKVPSGKGSPATASSQCFASASICGSCFAACCKEEEVHRTVSKIQNPLKWDGRCYILGTLNFKYSYGRCSTPHARTLTHANSEVRLLTFSLSSAVIPYPFGLSAMSVNTAANGLRKKKNKRRSSKHRSRRNNDLWMPHCG